MGQSSSETVAVEAFMIDAFEVTYARWPRCLELGPCPPIEDGEPGRPVVSVPPLQAQKFCEHAGGSLPTTAQFVLAAASPQGRRYPWGLTGAVCRRAVWGRVQGPCATGATGPELAGVYPDGATSLGVFDLAGNVAELTWKTPGVEVEVRGGSFRDEAASALRTWSAREASVLGAGADDVGFRCVYPPKPNPD